MNTRIAIAAGAAATGTIAALPLISKTLSGDSPDQGASPDGDKPWWSGREPALAISGALGGVALLTHGTPRKVSAAAALAVLLLGVALPLGLEKLFGDIPPVVPVPVPIRRGGKKEDPKKPGDPPPPAPLTKKQRLEADQKQLALQVQEAYAAEKVAQPAPGRARRPAEGPSVPQAVLDLKKQYWAAHSEFLDTEGVFGAKDALYPASYDESTGTLTLTRPAEQRTHPASNLAVNVETKVAIAADDTSVTTITMRSAEQAGSSFVEVNEISRNALNEVIGARNIVDSTEKTTAKMLVGDENATSTTTMHSETLVNAAGQPTSSTSTEKTVLKPVSGGKPTVINRTIETAFSEGKRASERIVTSTTSAQATTKETAKTTYNSAGEAVTIADSTSKGIVTEPELGEFVSKTTLHSETHRNAAGLPVSATSSERAVLDPKAGGESTIVVRNVETAFDSAGKRSSDHAVVETTAPKMSSTKVTDTRYNSAGKVVLVTGEEARRFAPTTDPATGFELVEEQLLKATVGDGTSVVTDSTVPVIDSTRTVTAVNPSGGFDSQHKATSVQVFHATGPATSPTWAPMVETITREGSGNRSLVEKTTYQVEADGTPIVDANEYIRKHPELNINPNPRNTALYQALQKYAPHKETVLDQRDIGDHFADFWSSSGRTLVAIGGAALVITGSVATLTGVGAPVGIPLIALGVGGATAETYSVVTGRQGASMLNVLGNVGLAAGGVGFALAPAIGIAGAAEGAASSTFASIATRVPVTLTSMAARVAQAPLAPAAAGALKYGSFGVGATSIGVQTSELGQRALNNEEITEVQVLNYLATIAGTAVGFRGVMAQGINVPRPGMPQVRMPRMPEMPQFSGGFGRFAPAPAYVPIGNR